MIISICCAATRCVVFPDIADVEDVVIIIGAEGSMLTIYSLQELEARRSDYPDESAVPAPLRMQHVLTAKLRKLVASGEWSTDLEGSCDKLHQTAVNELTQMKIPFNKDRWKFVPGWVYHQLNRSCHVPD